MRPKIVVALIVGSVAVAAGALNLPKAPVAATQKPHLLVGKAPDFAANSPDGKTYNLTDLIKNGSEYLYFIKKDCPINAQAVGFYANLFSAYGPKTPMLAVFNGSADEYKIYKKAHPMPFPVVLDADQKIISDYAAERSPWVVEVTGDQMVGHIWKGYSQDYLQQINQALAAALKAPTAKLDFSSAPKEPRYG